MIIKITAMICKIILTILQINPAVARPFPASFVTLIVFFAFKDSTMPTIARIKPITGIIKDKIPKTNEIMAFVFVFCCT